MDRSGPRVESNFHEITRGKLDRQLQQPAGNGNGLKFCARPLTAFGTNGRGDGSVQLHSG
jgi:hypothetical protein